MAAQMSAAVSRVDSHNVLLLLLIVATTGRLLHANRELGIGNGSSADAVRSPVFLALPGSTSIKAVSRSGIDVTKPLSNTRCIRSGSNPAPRQAITGLPRPWRR